MNEDEKKAIEIVKEIKDIRGMRQDVEGENEDLWALDTLINLINKQQKEIEDLKDKNETLEQLLQGNLYEMYKYYRELANSYQANCISKDKIKAKIKECNSILYSMEEEERMLKGKADIGSVNCLLSQIAILNSLLGETND